MRKLIAIAAAALFALPALAAPVYVPGQGGAVGPNVTCQNQDGATVRCIQPSVTLNDATGAAIGTSGNPLVTSAATGTTGDINLKQVNGATANTGHGVAAGSLRVELPTDGTGVVGLNAGSNIVGKVGIDQTTPGTTNGVTLTDGTTAQGTLANSNTGASATKGQGVVAGYNRVYNSATWDPWLAANALSGGGASAGVGAVASIATSSAGQAIAPIVSAAVESSHVICASGCNLYRVSITTGGSAGYLMVFNATSAPGDGAVTPKVCRVIAANSTIDVFYDFPERYGTGITVVFSTTGCFSKTASATAFFEVLAL